MGKKRIVAKSGEETLTVEKGVDPVRSLARAKGASPKDLGEATSNGVEVKISKKPARKQTIKGNIYINSSFNNTIVTVTDEGGNVIAWASAGNLGFKGTRKSTPFAATLVGKAAAEKAKRFGFSEAEVYVRGVGPGREAAIRGLFSAGIDIKGIIDNTSVPHGGVRPPKPRRV